MHPLTLYAPRSGLLHDTGPGHPECPDRLRGLLDLFETPPFDTLPCGDCPPAELDWIERAHHPDYVRALMEAAPDRGLVALDGDTVMSAGSFDAALDAAGAVCQAVADVAAGRTRRAFCAVRPPGHHAQPARAMGFCLLNNIFIGALHAQALGLRRVAIVDFDVHHGNGTDAMTRRATDIFFASSHQYPLWPMSGVLEGNIDGKVLNATLAAGDSGAAFRALYASLILPAVDAFRPDLLMISAGFDAHRDDPLAGLNLVEDDFAWVTGELVALAGRHCDGRIVSVLEGGYDLAALSGSVAAHVTGLMG